MLSPHHIKQLERNVETLRLVEFLLETEPTVHNARLMVDAINTQTAIKVQLAKAKQSQQNR
jgi:hypothetical protein